MSDVSTRSLNAEFDVSEATATAADSDVEDGFLDSAPLHPVSAARALFTLTRTLCVLLSGVPF